jgi:serine/threonine protein kinase
MGLWAPGRLLNEFDVNFNRPLGEGAFGLVYPGKQRGTHLEVAIKMISPESYITDAPEQDAKELIRGIERETDAFRQLCDNNTDHPHVVDVLDFFQGPGKEAVDLGLDLPPAAASATLHYFVMEKLNGVGLDEHIQMKGSGRVGLREYEAKQITKVLCKALNGLHENGIVHRDVKPANIFFSCEDPDHSDLKLIDFSAAGVVSSDEVNVLTDCVGTAGYVAPEVMSKREPYGPKADVFSLGCTIHAMLSNMYLPRRHPHLGYMLSLPPSVSEEALDLIDDLLAMNPIDRPSIPEVLASKWLQEVCE